MITQKICSFCGRPIKPGSGITVIMNDGSVLRFCSLRCRIYMLEHKKDPRKLKWTTKHTSSI
ncbi:MAG: 50S ribosomal protein L24e [Nitrososphaeria archaeon]